MRFPELRHFYLYSITRSKYYLKMVMPSAGYAFEVTDMEVMFDGKTLRKIETKYRFLKDPIIEIIVPKKSISR